MPRNIGVLPADLTHVIFGAGDRRVVLVEGKDDKATFDTWYSASLSEIEFFASGGAPQVRAFLPIALGLSGRKRIFGIIDRDWQEDSEVEAWTSEADPHLFVLTRYDLENYLLDPIALHRELSILSNHLDPAVATPSDVATSLLTICRRLCPILAANWVFYDKGYSGGIDYFDVSFFPADRNVVVRETAAKLNCDIADADLQISSREAAIVPYLTDVETAHKRIKAKTLLYQFHHLHVRSRMPVLESFRNLMVRAVKLNGIHADIREIIENRILDIS